MQVNLSLMSIDILFLWVSEPSEWMVRKSKCINSLKDYGSLRKEQGNIIIDSLISLSLNGEAIFLQDVTPSLTILSLKFPWIYVFLGACFVIACFTEKNKQKKMQEKPLLFEVSPKIYAIRNVSIIITFTS